LGEGVDRVTPLEQLGFDLDAAPVPMAHADAHSDAHANALAHVRTDAAGPNKSRSSSTVARRAQSALLRDRLHALGLHGVDAVVLMRTRRVMVSMAGNTLRVHEGFLDAPEPVLRAIVTFATARTRAARMQARDVIVGHPVDRPPPKRRAEPSRPGDASLLAQLRFAHAEFNRRHFGGTLRALPIKLSGRMSTRLGHYSPPGEDGPEAEIVLNRRHVQRDGWDEVAHTLLHEMVHQWQQETGRPLDHGPEFRRKAREVGVTPRARRPVDAPRAPRWLATVASLL
jgi:hypothetical protein